MIDDTPLRHLAARVAGQADLLDVRLTSCTCETLDVPRPDARLTFDLDIEPGVPERVDEVAVAVECTFTVSITEVDDEAAAEDAKDGPAGPQIARVSCSYAALYALDLDPAPTDDECDAFARTTGVFALYPYARAFIQDITARMGLPPLTLGISHSHRRPEPGRR
jgi:hypothetical protein